MANGTSIPARDDAVTKVSSSERRKVVGKVIVAATGFMMDAYDFFVINIVLTTMGEVYGSPTDVQKGFVASMALWGALAGQVLFGVLADKLGRRAIFVTTCALVILGSLSSCLVFESANFSIYWQTGMCRFVLGLGVGGEYPLSASVASEASDQKDKGRLTVIVFSMQGWGAILAPSVCGILLACGLPYEIVWRLSLGLAVIPMVVILPFRWRMEESLSFTAAKADQAKKRAAKSDFNEDKRHGGNVAETCNEEVEESRTGETDIISPSVADVPLTCMGKVRKYKYMMLGTAVSWFLLDICFYANSLFNADVTAALGFGSTPLDLSVSSIIVTAMALPGYWCSIFLMDRVGRKRLQLGGFLIIGVLFAVMATAYEDLLTLPGLFLFLYGLTFFFSNFGPNATTYTIAAEIYPSAVRATCHGISAATGKFGAALGAYMFPPIELIGANTTNTTQVLDGGNTTTLVVVEVTNVANGLATIMYICAVVSFVGAVWTWFFTPTYNDQDLVAAAEITVHPLGCLSRGQSASFRYHRSSYGTTHTQARRHA